MVFRLPPSLLYFETPDLASRGGDVEPVPSAFLSQVAAGALALSDGLAGAGGAVCGEAAAGLEAARLWRHERTHIARGADHVPSERERLKMDKRRKREEVRAGGGDGVYVEGIRCFFFFFFFFCVLVFLNGFLNCAISLQAKHRGVVLFLFLFVL
jgi:hypothetical protein